MTNPTPQPSPDIGFELDRNHKRVTILIEGDAVLIRARDALTSVVEALEGMNEGDERDAFLAIRAGLHRWLAARLARLLVAKGASK